MQAEQHVGRLMNQAGEGLELGVGEQHGGSKRPRRQIGNRKEIRVGGRKSRLEVSAQEAKQHDNLFERFAGVPTLPP
jgi:hypothetical protein